MYIQRKIHQDIIEHLKRKEYTIITGPRQSGKTSLLQALFKELENDKKKLSVAKLELLAKLFETDYQILKDLYFADKFAKEAFEYKCTEKVYALAETQSNYIREINSKQGKIKF